MLYLDSYIFTIKNIFVTLLKIYKFINKSFELV